MTKEELSNLQSLKREILDLERRKRDCEAAAMATTHILDGMPHNHSIDKVAKYGGDAAWLSIQIDNALARYRAEFKRLWEFIDGIPDSLTRKVFRCRYIDGMTLQRTAFEVGETDASYIWRIIEKQLQEE